MQVPGLRNSSQMRCHASRGSRFSHRPVAHVGHSPDFALGDVRANLLLAGHTHGGQVQLPFIGPLLTVSRVPRRWASGVTHLADDNKALIVSNGVGMERRHAPRIRFLCPPEVIIIELVPTRPQVE